jgi:hypothetical protein
VIGGTGSHLLGKRVIQSSREAFPPAPLVLRAELEPLPRGGQDADKAERRGLRLPRLALPRRRRREDADTADSVAPESTGPDVENPV